MVMGCRSVLIHAVMFFSSPILSFSFRGPTARPSAPTAHKREELEPGQGKYVFTLSDANFTEAATADSIGEGPLFVEFYAPWCSHCKNLAPIWSELASSLRGQVRVGTMDISSNPIIAESLHITAFPTLLFLVRGRIYHYDSQNDRSLAKLKSFALGGYHSADWKELPRDVDSHNDKSTSILLIMQYAAYQVVFGTFYFWKRARLPSAVTFLLGVFVGGLSTVLVMKAATNRHLAELEDELLDQFEALDRQRGEMQSTKVKGDKTE